MAFLSTFFSLFVLSQVFLPTQSALSNVTCHPEFMEAFFDKNSLKGASPHLKDEEKCPYKVTEKGNFVVVKIPYDNCGTKDELAENYIAFFNKVTVRPDNTGKIIRAEEEYPVGCVFGPFTGTVSRGKEPYEVGNLVSRFYGNSSYTFLLNLYKSDKFGKKVDLPYTPKLKERIFFELAVNETEGNMSLAVTECVTTPTDNINDDLQYTLIKDSCLLDYTMKEHPRPETRLRRYSFRSFVFKKKAPMVFLHCYLRVCVGPEKEKCEEGCKKTEVRRRREAEDNTDYITFGPIFLASGEDDDIDTPYRHDEKPLYLTVIAVFAGAALVSCGIIVGAVLFKRRQHQYAQAQCTEAL